MVEKLQEAVVSIVKDLYGVDTDVVFTRPEEEHGDFATNVALQLAGKLGKNPREVAEQIAEKLEFDASIAGPGFINIRVPDSDLFTAALSATSTKKSLQGKVIVTEYSDPNPFKVLHAGHLYTTLVGDAVSNILEAAGARVHRTNFGGDVGLHVGKAMWGIIKNLGGEDPERLNEVPKELRAEWISARYVEGNTAYESGESAKAEIMEVNKRVYKLHEDHDETSPFAEIYWTCRTWSYEGFEQLYDELQVRAFEKYYPESETSVIGTKLVNDGLEKGVFEKSDNAVVYRGEKDGLHTRVFQTSEGLPTYEAKDLGLAELKWQEYSFDQSVIITSDDQAEYMKVVVAALAHFHTDIIERTKHLTHGVVKLAGGKKMSSRAGSVVLAQDILQAATQASQKADKQEDKQIVLGAVRYSFLKNRIGSDTVYDAEESVSIEGNSGPYLQYALVRAVSIFRKAQDISPASEASELDKYERSLARKLSMYPEVFEASLNDYSPHHIANYLYELAVIFNRFYENDRVIDHERADVRVALLGAYESVLNQGLDLLGMPKPESM